MLYSNEQQPEAVSIRVAFLRKLLYDTIKLNSSATGLVSNSSEEEMSKIIAIINSEQNEKIKSDTLKFVTIALSRYTLAYSNDFYFNNKKIIAWDDFSYYLPEKRFEFIMQSNHCIKNYLNYLVILLTNPRFGPNVLVKHKREILHRIRYQSDSPTETFDKRIVYLKKINKLL